MTTRTTAAPFGKRLLARLLVGLVIAAALLAVLLWRVDFSRLRSALSSISVWHIVAACACRMAAIVFRALRWRRLGVVHERATWLDCLSANANGMLIGLAFPGLNEVTRAYVLKRRARVAFGSVLGVLMAERLLDMLLLLVLALVVLFLVPGIQWGVISSAILVVIAALGVGLVAVLLIARRGAAAHLKRLLAPASPRLAQRAAGFIGNFGEGLRRLGELRSPHLVEIGLLSALLWLSNSAFAYLVFRGFGPHLSLGFVAALFTVALIYLGLIIRLTPAGLGQYHAVIVIALGAFAVDSATALSVAFVLHGVMLVATILLGVPFVYREHLGLGRLAQEQRQEEEGSVGASTGAVG